MVRRCAWLASLVVVVGFGCAGHAPAPPAPAGPVPGAAACAAPVADVATAPDAMAPAIDDLAAATVGSATAPTVSPPFRYQYGLKIPMRDGVVLGANLYLPVDPKPVPAVFVKTPYIADSYHAWAVYFASHGYAVALVDARGRGNSDGTFRPAEDDGRDGADVVEWLARQPFCDGQVAMFGGSYDGFGQWATAKQHPAHLATIVPTAAVRFGFDFPMANNIGAPYVLEWLSYVSGRARASALFGDDPFWMGVFARYRAGHAFRDLDVLAGNTTTVFREWLAHPTFDAYWRDKAPLPAEMAKLDLPILTITGHYDDDQAGALSYYREHLANAPPKGRARHYLVMGPWDHGGTRTPQASFGGITFGPASLVDIKALHVQWFDWTMKHGPRPALLARRVAFYVDAADAWRSVDDLPAMTPTSRAWMLGSDGHADDVYRSGWLADTRAGAAEDVVRIDPRDPRIGALAPQDLTQLVDRPQATPPPGLALTYHSEPFAQDVELGGTLRVVLHLAMDVPDADLSVELSEVRADGRVIFLTADTIRARYRQDLDKPVLVPAGEVLEYRFERGNLFGRRLAKGSRLRLVIGPLFGPWPQVNYQGGGVVADETVADARTATVHLLHDAQHPSRIEVGVLAAASTVTPTLQAPAAP